MSTPKETLTKLRVIYKKVDNVELALHMFSLREHKPDDSRPAIVFFFGGGWTGGAPEQFFPQAEHFASRGMVAISAEYRVARKHGTDPRACVSDGKSAMRYIRSNARDLGIDPTRIAAGGGSAGGHVAAAAATLSGFNEDGEDTSVSCVPDALVLFNPVFDNGPGGYGHGRVKDYWEDFSPLHNLSTDVPPTVIFLGDSDNLIPVATAEAYRDAMRNLGIRCELHIYPGQGHGFFNKSRFKETLMEADRFLTSLGYME